MKFKKRIYERWGEFFADLRFLITNKKLIKKVMKGGLVPPAFRERLTMVVIAVYGCRYCSYVHTREALKSGLGSEEIARLLSGSVENCPEEAAAN